MAVAKTMLRRSFLEALAIAGSMLAFLANTNAAPAAQEFSGVFALADTAARSSAKMRAVSLGGNSEGLEFAFHSGGPAPVLSFKSELTKQLHVMIVSDDFMQFQHDHVEKADPKGIFRLKINFPHAGLYHVYADAAPARLGHQVFRFDLPVGVSGGTSSAPKLTASKLNVASGPYEVRIDPTRPVAGQETHFALHISKDGKPATDLSPYLGMAAHAVFISGDTLSYTHAHAAPASEDGAHHAGMAMLDANKPVGADLGLAVTLPSRGLYKVWLQFMGGGILHTVSFVIPAA